MTAKLNSLPSIHFNAIESTFQGDNRVGNNVIGISQKMPLLEVEETSPESQHHRAEAETALASPKHTTKWRRVSKDCLEFWLVKVELETHEERQDRRNNRQDGLSAQKWPIQRSSIQAQFRVPFLSRKVTVELQSLSFPPCNGFDLRLRTRNIIPKHSPIFVACDNLDFNRVKELLETKAASPFDYYYDIQWGDCSLIDRVCDAAFYDPPTKDFTYAADLINYLLPFYNDNPQMLNHLKFIIDVLNILDCRSQILSPACIDVLRAVLLYSKESPFRTDAAFSIGVHIPLSMASLPLPSFLLEQSYHEVDDADFIPGAYWENDRTMLSDPKGEIMQSVIRAGGEYWFYCYGKGYQWIVVPIYGMLRAVSISRTLEVEVCCRNRISFLIHLGYDLWKPNLIIEGDLAKGYIIVARFALQLNPRGLLCRCTE